MSSGQESIIAKDLINRPSTDRKKEVIEVPKSTVVVEKPTIVVEKQEKPLGEKFKDAVNEATEKAHEYAEAAEDKAFKLKDKAKEFMNESSYKAKDYTLDAQIKGAVLADRAHRAVNEKVEQAKDYASQMKASSTENASEQDLRDSQQKALTAGKRMENALNSLIDATSEALQNLGVKEKEHGEFKATDKSVDFSRGVRDQTAHSASRIHDPTIATPASTGPTTITSTEPFAPTENTTAVAESSFVPTEKPAPEPAATESSGGVTGFLSSLFRTSSPAPDVSADSFEQPLTSERSFVAEHNLGEVRSVPEPEPSSELTAERAWGAEQEAKGGVLETESKLEQPGEVLSMTDTARGWVQGSSERVDEEAKSTRQSDLTKTNQP